MNESDLELIEEKLGVRLPKFYEKYALVFPVVLDEGEPMGSTFIVKSSEMIDLNRELRSGGFYDLHWPDHFLAVGDDSCGNYYYIDLNRKECRVQFACHDDLEKHPDGHERLCVGEYLRLSYDEVHEFDVKEYPRWLIIPDTELEW